MQSSLLFPVTADDVCNAPNAPFRAGDFLTYVRARKSVPDGYVIARVNGVIGAHYGTPPGAQMVGRVTGLWSRV